MAGLLGKKIGMSRIHQDDGRVIPVTVLEVTPNTVTQLKTVEKEGYPAVVLGFAELKNPTKTKKYLVSAEFPMFEQEVKVGDQLGVDNIAEGTMVDVTSVTRGRGFQGGVKRWGFHGAKASHGHHFPRKSGSVGARALPGRVHRGKHMAGHMGCDTMTFKGREIVKVNKEKNLVAIKGSIAGAKGSIVEIKW